MTTKEINRLSFLCQRIISIGYHTKLLTIFASDEIIHYICIMHATLMWQNLLMFSTLHQGLERQNAQRHTTQEQ